MKREFPYLKDTKNGNFLCNRCGSVFSITHDGRVDVNSHFGRNKHKAAVEAAASSSRVTSFFNEIGSNTALALAAKEATSAFHTATRGKSFKRSNCTSKLVSNLLTLSLLQLMLET